MLRLLCTALLLSGVWTSIACQDGQLKAAGDGSGSSDGPAHDAGSDVHTTDRGTADLAGADHGAADLPGADHGTADLPQGDTVPPGPVKGFWTSMPAYPAVPAAGSTYQGYPVTRVTNRGELDAALGNNKVIVLADGNYQSGNKRLELNGHSNLWLIAEHLHGAGFEADNYNQENIILGNTSNVTLRGLYCRKSFSTAIKAGGRGYPSARGPNKQLTLEWLLLENHGQEGLKIDNGAEASYPASASDGIVVRYCTIRDLGRNTAYTYFAEAIYLGDGTYAQQNAVHNVQIYHNLISPNHPTSAVANVSGEGIEIKVWCTNVTIADNIIRNVRLGSSTSGGALALAVDQHAGATTGSNGYVVKRNRIYNITSDGAWSNGNAISVIKGNTTIQNNVIWNVKNNIIRIYQKNGQSAFDPNQLDVFIYHNTFVHPGGKVFYIDYQAPVPTAHVYLRGNVMTDGVLPANQGVNWTSEKNITDATAADFVTDNFSDDADDGKGGGIGIEYAPAKGSRLIGAGLSAYADSTDAKGAARPSPPAAGALEP